MSREHSWNLEAFEGGRHSAFVRSCYLITRVEVDDGTLTLELTTSAEVAALRRRLDGDGRCVLDNGRVFELVKAVGTA